MYWNLKATSDYFTNKELRDLGADTGAKLYESFLSACSRGVKIRILGAKNFGDSSSSHEVLEMQKQFPDCITFRQWDGKKWYDGGVMHQKIIIADRSSFYIGSANMDWLSLSNVKELGVIVHSKTLTQDLVRQFDVWFEACSLNPDTRHYFSKTISN